MSIFGKKLTARDMDMSSKLGPELSFAAAEAYKLLRANLLFSLPANEDKCRVIGTISSIPMEGKSTTTINLAYSIAETGKKVLLIDADMRLPTLAKKLDLQLSPGLSNLLAGLSVGNDVLRASGLHENLHVICAGDIPPNPSELLGGELMERVIASLSKSYDYILFDLPPVTTVSDGLVLSKLLDGMVVVVRRGFCDKQSLAEAMRQIQFRNVKVLGFVLTRSEISHKSKKHGYGYGYSRKPAANREK